MKRGRSLFAKYRNKSPLPLDDEYLTTLSAKVMSSDRSISLVDCEIFSFICLTLSEYRDKNNVDSINWEEYKNIFIDNKPPYAEEINTNNPEEMYVLAHHRMRACQLYVEHNFKDSEKELNKELKDTLNNNTGGNA